MWNNVVELDVHTGLYEVCGKKWTVGARYKLFEHIGGGSYGDVCQARDCETLQIVALKRIANILSCPMLAKRVLREVCIMRRLSHPCIITLTDVFTNQSVDKEGGIDLYIATEFAELGDMYHLKQPISPNDVKKLIWQLLMGVRYMHSCRVWHRDIKSENILLTSKMLIKICDFGLSRSAEEGDSNFESRHIQSNGRSSGRKVLRRQYTKMVVTPSYRAPEVIMSRGQYSSSIDIWSVGCIFWELLARSINPNIEGPLARPLFGVRGDPVTPVKGENYADDQHSPLAEQLDVIFNVIGTPCWKDIESVPSETWRSYLKRLPGRAGNLVKSLCACKDDDALDLLSRMLSFDPDRRCTAEEAIAHAYLKGLKKPGDLRQLPSEGQSSSSMSGTAFGAVNDPATALEYLERELEGIELEGNVGREKLYWLMQREVEQQQQQYLLWKSYCAQSIQASKIIWQPSLMLVEDNSKVPMSQNELAQQGLIQFPILPSQKPFGYNSHEISGVDELSAVVEKRTRRPLRCKTMIRNGSFCVDMNRMGGNRVEVIDLENDSSADLLQDVYLPRRSPRLQDRKVGEIPPLHKRTRFQAG